MLISLDIVLQTCQEQAKRGDMANLIHFIGSDTTVADRGIDFTMDIHNLQDLNRYLQQNDSDAQLFPVEEGEYEYIKHMLTVAPIVLLYLS